MSQTSAGPSGAGQGAAAARAAKAHVKQLVGSDARVNGVGLMRVDSAWAVKVNVVDADDAPDLPTAVDGVPVRCAVVGRVTARAS